MTERYIPLSKFIGEPPDILERLSQEPEEYPIVDVFDLPVTEEYRRNQELKKEQREKEERLKADDDQKAEPVEEEKEEAEEEHVIKPSDK